MQSFKLRHRIEFQRQIETQNPVNGDSEITWQTVVLGTTVLNKVPAEVLTGAGREFLESATKQAEVTARINLRWFPGLLPTWRIVWDSKIYNITSIATDITARRDYYLQCGTGVNDGQ